MWPFKRKSPTALDIQQVKKLLYKAVETQNREAIMDLCNTHQILITQHFSDWAKVPNDIRNNPSATKSYANFIVAVAECFANDLRQPELIQRLTGPDETNPLLLWQKSLEQARSLMSELHYQEAISLLSAVLAKVQGQVGPGADKYLPITLGYLGESYFQTGDLIQAISETEKALKLCEHQRDIEGVRSYLGNLYEICRYGGLSKKAATWAERLASVIESGGQLNQARWYRNQAKRLRVGEPLNRVVVQADGEQFELDEMSRIKSEHVRFVFQRNRISLRPAQGLIEHGEQLGRDGKFDEALTAFQEASRCDPYEPHSRYLSGLTLLHLRRYAEAIENYQATETLAPGWFNCRSDLWLAKQLALGNVSHEVFLTLRILEDQPTSPDEKVLLAKRALNQTITLAPLYLFYGKNLAAVGHTREAENTYREGVTYSEEPDIRTRLLLQLGIIVTSSAEKRQLFQQAISENGNLTASAMALFGLSAL